MRRFFPLVALAPTLIMTGGCATVAGGLIGAGIGPFSGDIEKGALIGGGAGAVVDIIDD